MTQEVNAPGGQYPGRSTHQEVNAPKTGKVNAPGGQRTGFRHYSVLEKKKTKSNLSQQKNNLFRSPKQNGGLRGELFGSCASSQGKHPGRARLALALRSLKEVARSQSLHHFRNALEHQNLVRFKIFKSSWKQKRPLRQVCHCWKSEVSRISSMQQPRQIAFLTSLLHRRPARSLDVGPWSTSRQGTRQLPGPTSRQGNVRQLS